MQESLEEYADIINEVQLQVQTYDDYDNEALVEQIVAISDTVDIGDPYDATFNCSTGF